MPSMHRNPQTQQTYKKTQKQSEAATEAEEKKKQIDDLGFEVSHMIMLQQKNYFNSANSFRSTDRGK